MLGGRVMGAAPAPGDAGPPKGFGGDPCMPSNAVSTAGVPGSAGPGDSSRGFTQHRKVQKSFHPCLLSDAFSRTACASRALAVDRNAQAIGAVMHSR